MMLLTKIEPEAFFTVSEQTELFLLSVLAGVTFGVLWDVFRALRVMLPPMRSTALTAVCDALYMIICGLGLYIFSLLFAGRDKGVLLAGCAAGGGNIYPDGRHGDNGVPQVAFRRHIWLFTQSIFICR